ncbi:MAG: hypothetical protein J6X58_00195 [Bacteroidales bacterium]|nr:hypothetical protein [Bacteroidales bacterium]
MNKTGKVICGIAFLLFGIIWILEIFNVISFDYKGWWTIFVIIPFFIGFFTQRHKAFSIIGIGIGVLLFLSARDIVSWNNFWKLVLCLIAIVSGITMIFGHKNRRHAKPDGNNTNGMRQENRNGHIIHKANVSFGKRIFEFAGQRFEGAEVQANFGFVAIDLRNADIMDGAVIEIDCNCAGMEIRVGNDICIKDEVDTSFAGIENNRIEHSSEGSPTVILKGKCNFGGIEIK